MRCALATVILAAFASAQGDPHIGYAFPAGGRAGTTVDVEVGGQRLRAVDRAYVSGGGVHAEVVAHDVLLSQRELGQLRDQARELEQRRTAARRRGAREQVAWTAANDENLAALRAKLRDHARRRDDPAIADRVVVRVRVDAGAALGARELRLGTPAGLTNPLVLRVGELPEIVEQEPEPAGFRRDAARPSAAPATIEVPAVVNGRIGPGDVDRFRFRARRGQRLVAAASARALVPYLADAVPGWFQATLALRDADGRELAFADDHLFDPDPVLCHEIPADGIYEVEIRDAIYRGRDDFVYRLTLGELPLVTGIFPLGGAAGEPIEVQLRGWNLPAPTAELPASTEVGIARVALPGAGGGVRFARDTLPERIERETNDAPDHAEPLAGGVIVNGHIERPGDVDVFRIEGRAGDAVVAELLARRLGSPLDATLWVTDARGARLGFCDDHVDRGAGLTTHHADPWLCVELPAAGTYYVHLADAQGHGGELYAYRLRVGPPRPAFELRVVPSAVNARAGATVPLTVEAIRRDGFAGEIRLALAGAPQGFVLAGGRIPAGHDRVVLTLTVPPRPVNEPIALRMRGSARIGSRREQRDAVPADDLMQAFLYRHLVPASELLVSVGRGGRTPGSLRVANDDPLRIPVGGKARIRLALPEPARSAAGRVRFELRDPPAGVTLGEPARTRDGIALVVTCDEHDATPGLRGNLIVEAMASAPQRDGRGARRTSLGLVPAIPFEIVTRDEE